MLFTYFHTVRLLTFVSACISRHNHTDTITYTLVYITHDIIMHSISSYLSFHLRSSVGNQANRWSIGSSVCLYISLHVKVGAWCQTKSETSCLQTVVYNNTHGIILNYEMCYKCNCETVTLVSFVSVLHELLCLHVYNQVVLHFGVSAAHT